MAHIATVKDRYLADFQVFDRSGTGRSPAWLRETRRAAITRFSELGFPTTRDEDWKYTNVAPIVTTPFRFIPEGEIRGIEPETITPFRLGGEDWIRLVFVDGRYSPRLSAVDGLPDGVRAGSLGEAITADAENVRTHLTRHARDADGFVALSTAFLQDGAFVYVPQGRVVEAPIHLLFVTTVRPSSGEAMALPRNLIVTGPHSQATVVESHVSLLASPHLTNAVTEVVVGDGAILEHCKLQEEGDSAFHVGTLHVCQERDSSFSSCSLALGGGFVRNTLRVLLNGEGAVCGLNGLYVLGGRQHVDNHVTVDHAKPHCTSRQLYKGILDGRSRAVFNGRIIVRRGAQKTDAHQTNKNLLLSDGPEVNSKPWLEIFTDDVKCSHGAADGQLAEDAIFYLRSRGLGEDVARTLLTYGFANEVVERLRIEAIRTHVDTLLMARIQKDPGTRGTS